MVYGGASVGLMGVISDSMISAGGDVIGVMPECLIGREIAATRLKDLRIVRTMHDRKAMMSDLSDAFIAMPGGMGTLDEFCEVMTWCQVGIHQKPVGLLNIEGYFDPFLAFLKHAVSEKLLPEPLYASLQISSDPEDLLDKLRKYQPTVLRREFSRNT